MEKSGKKAEEEETFPGDLTIVKKQGALNLLKSGRLTKKRKKKEGVKRQNKHGHQCPFRKKKIAQPEKNSKKTAGNLREKKKVRSLRGDELRMVWGKMQHHS